MKSTHLPSLAVVVPAYNEAGQLEQCLENLLEQADELAEIIVVDNNSTDGTLDLAKRYAANDTVIKVLTEKRQGLVATRNHGFLAAKAEIIARIDADTLVQPGWALAIRRHFAKHPSIAAITGDTHYYDAPMDWLTSRASALILDKCNRAAGGFPCLYGPNMAIRTNIAKQLAGESCAGQINEDLDLTIHLFNKDLAMGYEPAMLAYVSSRRLRSTPASYYLYCLNWPRTFWRHGMHFSAVKAWLMATLLCFVVQSLVFLPLRAYDAEVRRFRWRQLVASVDTRIIP